MIGRRLLLLFMLTIGILIPDARSQGSKNYRLIVSFADKDSNFHPPALQLQSQFADKTSCLSYINALPSLLGTKGYPAASVDSMMIGESSAAIKLFLGKQYQWIRLSPGVIEKKSTHRKRVHGKTFCRKIVEHATIAAGSTKGAVVL